ncbi:MAG: hypothetical protein ABI885_04650 [Gammaproteobacteria bacterium]
MKTIVRRCSALASLSGLFLTVSAQGAEHLSLRGARVEVDSAESSYVRYGAEDLRQYLAGIAAGTPNRAPASGAAGGKITIAIGPKAARTLGVDPGPLGGAGEQASIIKSFVKGRETIVVIAGRSSAGTNGAIATFMQMIRAEGGVPFVEGPLDVRNDPAYAARGIHLNGWPLNYPYAFRSWKEEDWKKFVDLAWAQRINLFYLWPFMEIIPVPLSKQDEAYLREVSRVVAYAREKRGMEVWIMQSANRIGITDCGSPDPRTRTYWVNGCQKDMNPSDPAQVARALKSFEALYSIVANADGFCMIDSDPGGWPQSPLSEQVNIFKAARKLLDTHSAGKQHTKLINWMHVGWGRHKFPASTDSVVGAYDWNEKNPDESDVAFMTDTIRNFQGHLAEPWALIAGHPPYLPSVAKEGVLGKTVYLPYGAIESEPAFPATNLGQDSVRRVFEVAARYPGLRGVMGNNQLSLLQLPRTFYFFASAWNSSYLLKPEDAVLRDLGEQLYPEHAQLVADAFLALRATDVEHIAAPLAGLEQILQRRDAGRMGALGRALFPDPLALAKALQMQLQIRLARQELLAALLGKPSIDECATLVERYLDRLLAWNRETGWDRMIKITVWPIPIYEGGKDLTQGLYRLKQLLAGDAPYASYAQINRFFDRIGGSLLRKYDEDSVMVGGIEPLKLAVIQSQ